ncbi:MAG: hypothetical protein NVSMB9_12200 [Isosphaeraceae bacterium]
MALSNQVTRARSGESANSLPHRPATTPRLIVFTRFPEPGKAKTRLIAHLGAAGAADLQRRLTAHTLASALVLLERAGVGIEVRFDGGSETAMRAYFGDGVSYRPQGAGDLGERMARSVAVALNEGASRVVLIGSDCPGITPDLLERAFTSLVEDPDRVVLGPALDGGYYLIGLGRERPELFREISWGSDRVLNQTETVARSAGIPLVFLEPLADVDRPEDLHVWDSIRDKARANPGLSVIIPALNEEAAIERTLDSALRAESVEVIVVDGGSYDRTIAIASARDGVLVISCPPGRASQMNAGAVRAKGDILVFLHADTILPAGYDRAIAETLQQPGTSAGAFRLRIDGSSRSFRVIEALVHWRSTALQTPYGDQALFLNADTFRQLGGFPDLPIMEDLELTRRLRARGVIRMAPVPVQTSARRWLAHGVWRMTFRNQLCLAAYFLGVPPQRIAAWRGAGRDRVAVRSSSSGEAEHDVLQS